MTMRELFNAFNKARLATEDEHRRVFLSFCKKNTKTLPPTIRFWYKESSNKDQFFDRIRAHYAHSLEVGKRWQKQYQVIYKKRKKDDNLLIN